MRTALLAVLVSSVAFGQTPDAFMEEPTENEITVKALKEAKLNALFSTGDAWLTAETMMRNAQLLEGCKAELSHLQSKFPSAPQWVPWLAGGVAVAIGIATGVLVGFFAFRAPTPNTP